MKFHRRFLNACCALVLLCIPTLADDGRVPGSYSEPVFDPVDAHHWAFLPPQKNEPAGDENAHPIDALISRRLKEAGLTHSRKAGDLVLLRRLCLNLTGLPPTRPQIKSCLADGLNVAQLMDELLASPRYGEHWAQHWLDLARFAETDGFEHDKIRPNAWKYRDWVINALNKDLPYDEFLRQQLAGDELYPDSEAAKTATMFLLSGPDMPDINLLQERRHDVLNELTGTLGEVVLGLQLGCAQCHDHKYDPISQADFYRLRAIFEPAVPLKKNQSLSTLQNPESRSEVARLMLRGDFRRPGPELQPDVPRVLAASVSFHPAPEDRASGQRTALANWLVRPEHPLTARVIVNRMWQHHFGQALVDTPSDFGLVGSVPDHPQLLDFLAVWLVEHNWSLKDLHRLIVTSRTWQQRSFVRDTAPGPEREHWMRALAADPDLRLLSRYPRRRLSGEVIRDCMLAATGRLNLKMGGPGIRPPLPPELKQTLLRNQWNVTPETAEHDRRSIYIFARRNLRFPIFESFDRPNANASCAVRQTSTTAPQALYLLNSDFAWSMSEQLAENLSTKSQEQSIHKAWLRILSRPPDVQELADARALMAAHQRNGLDDEQALAHVCLTLFNTNEFLYVD